MPSITQTRRHVKTGDNVIRVNFQGEAFTDEEAETIHSSFSAHGYQFSYVDESKVPQNHFGYNDIMGWVTISYSVYETLKNAEVYPPIWDSIKWVVSKIVRRRYDLKEPPEKATLGIFAH